jgi:hypothetical protein
MVSRNTVHEVLLKHAPEISAEAHRRILDGMTHAGIIDGNGGAVIRAASGERHLLSPMKAAAAADDEHKVQLLKNVARRAARVGFEIVQERQAAESLRS